MHDVFCPYCKNPATLVSGSVIYPHRTDLHEKKFWQCAPCDAYVGCHRPGIGYGDGSLPLGRLANKELRSAKQTAHSIFDPLWLLSPKKFKNRKAAYLALSQYLSIPIDECHIGMFDVDQCRSVVQFSLSQKR